MTISFVGLDVHLDATAVHVLDETGRDFMSSHVATTGAALIAIIDSLRGEVRVAMEECEFAHWLSEILEPRVAQVVVCNASKIVRSPGADKDDEIDAKMLAELLMLNRLQPVHHGKWRSGALREYVRVYERATQGCTTAKSQLKAMLRRAGVSYRGLNVYRERDEVLEALPKVALRLNAETLYDDIDLKEAQRDRVRRVMVDEARKSDGYRCVLSVPGFGPVRTAQLLGLIGTPRRFGGKRKLWQYASLGLRRKATGVHRRSSSGLVRDPKKVRVLGLNQDGNKALKKVVRDAADTAIRHAPEVTAYYEAQKRRKNNDIARVMVARKLLTVCWTLWKRKEEYDPDKAQWKTA